MPGFLDDEKAFRGRYVRSGAEKPEDIDGLRIKVAPFMLRRLKSEVATELPPKTEQIIRVPLAAEQQVLYDQMRDLSRTRVMDTINQKGMGGSTVTILDALLKLRQVACHPQLLKHELAEGVLASSKHDILHELIDEAVIAEGHRALIFSQFTSHLAIVKEWLDERGIPYFYLDGGTRKRQSLVDRFNAVDGPPIFLISLKAGGTGLNLTAADYVIHLDPWWNPAVQQQATDRAHRIGQQKPVVSVRFIASDTVEERVLQMQEQKRGLADSVLGRDGGFVNSLSADELRALFDGME